MNFNATLAEPDSTNKLAAGGELVYKPLVPGELSAFDSGVKPLLRLGVNGSADHFSYGLNYQSVGKGLEELATTTMKKDRRGGDVWAEGRLGMGRLKLSLARYSDNVDADPRRIRTARTQGGVALEIAAPSWPTLSVSYASGVADSEPVPGSEVAGARHTAASVETLGASLYYYGGSSWDVSVSSAYSHKRDTAHQDQETTELTCDLNGTYRPTDTVIVTPALSYWEERYQWLRQGMQTMSASLTVGYTPPSRVVNVSLYGSYSSTVSSDGYVDGSAVNVKSTLEWVYGKASAVKRSLALELGYNRYLDAVYSASSYQGVSVLVRFRGIRLP